MILRTEILTLTYKLHTEDKGEIDEIMNGIKRDYYFMQNLLYSFKI